MARSSALVKLPSMLFLLCCPHHSLLCSRLKQLWVILCRPFFVPNHEISMNLWKYIDRMMAKNLVLVLYVFTFVSIFLEIRTWPLAKIFAMKIEVSGKLFCKKILRKKPPGHFTAIHCNTRHDQIYTAHINTWFFLRWYSIKNYVFKGFWRKFNLKKIIRTWFLDLFDV